MIGLDFIKGNSYTYKDRILLFYPCERNIIGGARIE